MTGSMSAFCSGEHGCREEFETDGLSLLSRRTAGRSRMIACVTDRHEMAPSDALEIDLSGGKTTIRTHGNFYQRSADGMSFLRKVWADDDASCRGNCYVDWTGVLQGLGLMGCLGEARNTLGAGIAREALGDANLRRLPYFNVIHDRDLSMLVDERPSARQAKSLIDAYPALSSWLDYDSDEEQRSRKLLGLSGMKFASATTPWIGRIPAWLKGQTWRPPGDYWLGRCSVIGALTGLDKHRAPKTEKAWKDFLFVAISASECLSKDSNAAIAHLGPDWSTAASELRGLIADTATPATREESNIGRAVALFRNVSHAFQTWFVREVLAGMDAKAAKALNLVPAGCISIDFDVGHHGEQAVRNLLWSGRTMEEAMRLATGLTRASVVPDPADARTNRYAPLPHGELNDMWPAWAATMPDAPSDWRHLSGHPAMAKLREAIHEDIKLFGGDRWL